MGRDRNKPTPQLAAAIAKREAMRNARTIALEAKVNEQAAQIRSLRVQLARSLSRVRVLEAAE